MDTVISFEDNTCPICGGKIVLNNKNMHNQEQMYTNGYVCDSCGYKYGIEWIPDESNEYHPYPLYTPSKVKKIKDYFSFKEESKHVKTKHYDGTVKQNQPDQKEN